MINTLEKIFNKIILNLKLIKRRITLTDMFCKKCGHTMHYDYSVSDEDWNKLLHQYNILCWNCFCDEYPNDVAEVEVEFIGGKNFLKNWDKNFDYNQFLKNKNKKE